jgi:hypothetical protein
MTFALSMVNFYLFKIVQNNFLKTDVQGFPSTLANMTKSVTKMIMKIAIPKIPKAELITSNMRRACWVEKNSFLVVSVEMSTLVGASASMQRI